MNYELIYKLIFIGGIGQIFTALIYPYIRHHVFDWYNDVKKLKPLNQEIAKTYGSYIQGLNFAFGLIAILVGTELLDGSSLALALTGLIAFYWGGKCLTQFIYYPMYDIPDKAIYKIGEVGMNSLFIFFAGLYLWMFGFNLYQFLAW